MNKQNDIYQDVIDYIRKEADTSQQENVKHWLSESENNEREYKDLLRTFYKASFPNKWDRIDTPKAKNNLLTQLRKQKRLKIYRFSAIAASIALLVSFSLIFYVDQMNNQEDQLSFAELSSPGEFKASLILSSGETVLLSQNTQDSLSDAGTIINHNTDEGINYSKNKAENQLSQKEVYNTLRVARGEEYKVVLADGTQVWLNSESELRYPIAFVGKQRKVYVKGEAYFDVTPNKDKAFIVQAGDVKTKVLGTEFNVMAYSLDDQIEVTLVEGKVNVEAGGNQKTILPGKQITVSKETLDLEEKTVNTNLYSSWKDGIIYFDELTLEKMTEKLGRWYDIDFVFEEERLKHYAFTGAVKKNKSLEFTLDFLRTTSNLKFRVEKDMILVFEENQYGMN